MVVSRPPVPQCLFVPDGTQPEPAATALAMAQKKNPRVLAVSQDLGHGLCRIRLVFPDGQRFRISQVHFFNPTDQQAGADLDGTDTKGDLLADLPKDAGLGSLDI